jgi:molybdopterin converting factor small subunit
MARVTVKLFGVLRVDTGLTASEVNANRLGDIFGFVNEEINEIHEERLKEDPSLERPDKITFSDAIVYVNGKRCRRRGHKLADGDEIWLMSPASGG